jgi:ATP-dependent DNA helicase DinG
MRRPNCPAKGPRAGSRRRPERSIRSGPIERFLVAALEQLRARTNDSGGPGGIEFGLECSLRPVTDPVLEAAREAARTLASVEAPLLALSRHLEDILDDESVELDGSSRARIEGALRGLDRRARMTLPGWRSMLAALDNDTGEADPDFVDWLSAEAAFGRIHDVALRRHWIDPTVPLEAAVVMPSHGVLITSATLSDPMSEDPFDLARMRSGAARLIEPARTLKVESPFDYAENSRVIVVNDLIKDDTRQTAAAMRELFLAAGGGGVGLFTAIRRLKAVYERLGPDLAKAGLPLYAQHVDPLEVGALVDVFRAEQDSCLLGTDAVGTEWTCPDGRCASSPSTGCRGRAPTCCTRRGARSSADRPRRAAPMTTPWPARRWRRPSGG